MNVLLSDLRTENQEPETEVVVTTYFPSLERPPVMHRDGRADRHRNRRIHNPVINTAANLAFLQLGDSILNLFHPARLTAAHQHVHLGLQPPQFLQDLSLKVAVRDTHHQWLSSHASQVRII